MRLPTTVVSFLFGSVLSVSAACGQEAPDAAGNPEDVAAMVGQMFMVEFKLDADRYNPAKGGNYRAAIADMLELVGTFQIGGFVNEGGNDPVYLDPGFAAVRRAQTRIGLSPIVAVNEEGGRVQLPTRYWYDRVSEWIGCTSLGVIPGYRAENEPPWTRWSCPNHDWSVDILYLPFLRSAHLMGALWTTGETESHAGDIGRALALLNITMTLAPVLGVSDGTKAASFLADRTFADEPAKVAAFAGAFSRGIRSGSQGRVATVVKHFPGLGAVLADTDDGPARSAPLAVLEGRDLLPYREPIAAYYGAAGVMMSNVIVPGLTCPVDDQGCAVPATLSPAAYRFLREEFGWTGLIMTDTLQTKAILGPDRTMPAAVVAAIAAGADMVLFKPGGDKPTLADYHALLADVRDAVLDWVALDPAARTARIARSVARIRAVKESIADRSAGAR
jgi:Glycosyl hydrolase family 3 N terminal domain